VKKVFTDLVGEPSMKAAKYITIPQLAKLLGISRVAVYRRVRAGQIKAVRIGRAFAIPTAYVATILGKQLSADDKKRIDAAVRKTVREYGETLSLLAGE